MRQRNGLIRASAKINFLLSCRGVDFGNRVRCPDTLSPLIDSYLANSQSKSAIQITLISAHDVPCEICKKRVTKMPSKATEPKYSIAKVAAVIGVHPATISRLMSTGKLGYYQVGDRKL